MSNKAPRQVADEFITTIARATRGETVDPFCMLDDDVYYVRHGVEGSAVKCKNLAEVREKVLPPEIIARVKMRPGNGLYPIEYIEEEDRVVVLVRGRVDNTRGIPYNNTYFFLLEVRDGKIVRVVEDLDASISRRYLYDMHLEEGNAPL